MVTTVVPAKPTTTTERIKTAVSSDRIQFAVLLGISGAIVAAAPLPLGSLGGASISVLAFLLGRRAR
jgi:hypothetical protein